METHWQDNVLSSEDLANLLGLSVYVAHTTQVQEVTPNVLLTGLLQFPQYTLLGGLLVEFGVLDEKQRPGLRLGIEIATPIFPSLSLHNLLASIATNPSACTLDLLPSLDLHQLSLSGNDWRELEVLVADRKKSLGASLSNETPALSASWVSFADFAQKDLDLIETFISQDDLRLFYYLLR